MKNKITGRSAFLALLKDEGITHLFGNPGTTELPIMHALKDHPDLTYVMAMQESLVVAIADGYSRASGKLVACNVHVAPGLGNAMGSLYNAQFTGTPMILTAGQQEQGHGLMEPVLYGPLVRMAEPLVKWAVEVTRLEDLPRIVRRAAKVAMTPPTGPVFISLPGDILNSEAGIDLGRSTRIDARVKPSDEALKAFAARLLKAERPVIVTMDEVVKSDALKEAPPNSPSCLVRPPISPRRPTARISSRKARASSARWPACRRSRATCLRRMTSWSHSVAIPCGCRSIARSMRCLTDSASCRSAWSIGRSPRTTGLKSR
ncbi:glyoxylate carboligase [Bradyrhizobium sp. i1.3.6]